MDLAGFQDADLHGVTSSRVVARVGKVPAAFNGLPHRRGKCRGETGGAKLPPGRFALQPGVILPILDRRPRGAAHRRYLPMPRLTRRTLLALGALASLALPAGAQDFPTKPVTLVIPFAAGGSTDVVGRIIAERMSGSSASRSSSRTGRERAAASAPEPWPAPRPTATPS